MQIRNTLIILLIVVSFIFISCESGEKKDAAKSVSKINPRLRSEGLFSSLLRDAPQEERAKILDQFVARRCVEIQGMLVILSNSAKELSRSQRIEANCVEWYATKFLGEARAVEAVPILVDHIAVRDSHFSPVSNEYIPHWLFFPCAVALSKIGMPAVDPLLNRIQSSALTSTVFHVSCSTLEAILGEELAVAAVRQHAKKHPEEGQEGWLAEAIKLVGIGHVHWDALTAKDFRFE